MQILSKIFVFLYQIHKSSSFHKSIKHFRIVFANSHISLKLICICFIRGAFEIIALHL